MPNNCSTLIQRKQNILHKILRSSSEDKLQNAVAETTSELRVAGTRKVAGCSASANHLSPTSPNTQTSTARRTNLFSTNRIQPTNDQYHETHLPSIRDAAAPIVRSPQSYDDLNSRSRPKTPLTTASPKSTARPPSASISSLFNTIAKRSTDNMLNSNGEVDELTVPQSRQSRRPSNESNKNGTNQTPTKQTQPLQKQSGDSGVESRYSTSPLDINQQYRTSIYSNRFRSSGQLETSPAHETITKERTNNGQLYQRRANNNIKAPTKQKIDKYRRRSEEVTQAATTHGNPLLNAAHAGLSATTPALATTTSTRTKPPSTPTPVRRVTSDAEIQARLEVLRLSMESNVVQAEQNTRQRPKSPYLYSTHQQLARPITPQQQPTSTIRRSQGISSNIHASQRQTIGPNYRRQQQQQSSMKQSNNSNQGNLYLAFIASRHLSTLEDTLFDCDIDHPKLLRIFTWLKNVEEHRHEQADHDKLIREQNQRMADQEDNLSLYSEIRYAVDDLPPNTTGKPCEKIPTMQFED